MQASGQTGERNYKAFISYRHKPLDMETAKKLHRRIEQYVIPKELRRNGEKKLGLVFRDQDELPISNNLTENISMALDHSEYLIVVCTPDTPESVWVQREIAYFKKHHDDNHVLAILAAGTPETSFPPQLTEKRDSEGNLTDVIEPLAANIVADSKVRRSRLFRTESLRILASLIGCPYDALYRREQRHRMRQLAAGAAAVVLILSAFIGVLLNRNAKIREQYRNTQISESRTLSSLSENADREGNYRASIEYALSALPGGESASTLALMSENADREGNYRASVEYALSALPGRDPDRPYVAAAEYALSSSMYLYQRGNSMRYLQSFQQDTPIVKLALSDTAENLVTADAYGTLRMYHAVSGKLLWEVRVPRHEVSDLHFVGEDIVIATRHGSSEADTPNTVCYAVGDGSVRWELDAAVYAYSEGSAYGFAVNAADSGYQARIRKIDLRTGQVLGEIQNPEDRYPDSSAYAISPDGQYGAILYKGKEDMGRVVIYDFEKADVCHASSIFFKWLYVSFRMQFSEKNELILVCSGDTERLEGKEGWNGPYVALLDPSGQWEERFHTIVDFGGGVKSRNGVVDDSYYPEYLQCGTDVIAVSARNRLVMLEKETGEIRWAKDLTGYIVAADLYENGSMGLVLSDGVITLCEGTTGTLSVDYMMGYFTCDFSFSDAVVTGSRYRLIRAAFLSQKDRTRVSMAGFCEGEDLEEFPYAAMIASDAKVYTSPSGTLAAAVARKTDTRGYWLYLMDPSGEKEPLTFDLGTSMSSLQERQIFVTDSGKVILGDHVVEPAAGKETWMTVGEEENISRVSLLQSCREVRTGAVLSAWLQEVDGKNCMLYIWKDGEKAANIAVPVTNEKEWYSLSDCVCRAVGGNGYAVTAVKVQNRDPWQYAICSLEDGTARQTDCLNPEEEEVLAIADLHPWMAVQEKDGALRLVDLTSGKDLRTFESTLPGRGVTRLLFANQDEWLLAFTDAGMLGIFSTRDGKQLQRLSFAQNNIRFRPDARYETFLLPEQNRLLIVDSDEYFTEAICLSLDTRSMEKNGVYLGLSNYLPSLGRAVIVHQGDELCLAPVLSLEEIQAKGEKFLEEGLPGEKQ